MNKGVLITIALLVVAGGAVAAGSKVNNISSKFKGSAGLPGDISLKGGELNMNLPITLTNQSAIDVTLKNLYVTLQNRDSSGQWQDLFIQKNAVKEVAIKQYVTSKLGKIPLTCSYLDGVQIVNMLTGRQDHVLKVLVRFDVFGVELKPLEFLIDAKQYFVPLKTILKSAGLMGSDNAELGYSNNSFHYREITPGTKYESLMPKSKGIESFMANDAIPERTAKRMAQIVDETLWQTEKLAPALKGNNLQQTCKNVYTFLYNHIQYKRDAEDREQLREPIAAFSERKTGIDCDCFSIFASSILSNLNINHAIKVISLRGDKALQHVYIIVPKDGNTVDGPNSYFTIDPCLHSFNEEAKGITKEIFKSMITTRLSGLFGDYEPTVAANNAEPLPIDGLEGYLAAVKAATKAKNPAAVRAVVKSANAKVTARPVMARATTAVNPAGKLVTQKPCSCNKAANPSCKCAAPNRNLPTPNVTIAKQTGPEVKQIRPYNESELNHMSNVALEPVHKMLTDTLDLANKNPQALAPLYDVPNLKMALTNVLQNWNDPAKRDMMLESFEKQEDKLLNKKGLAHREIQFAGLGDAYIDPVFSYPLMGLDANDEFVITGLGGLFKSIKSAAKAVGGAVKKAATVAVKSVAKAAVKTATVVKKAAVAVGTGVKNAAIFVAKNIQKINPLMIAGRTAFRALVALNFRGWGTNMKGMIDRKQEGTLKSKWTGAVIGGNWGDLVSSINSGAKKKALLGGIGGLGQLMPYDVPSLMVVSVPRIMAMTEIKSGGGAATPDEVLRSMVAMNFEGWASTLKKLFGTKHEAYLITKWTSKPIYGNYSQLVKAINAGASKKAPVLTLGQLGQLGEPVTVGSSLVAAAPIIKLITDLIKGGGGTPDAAQETTTTTENSAATAQPEMTTDSEGNPIPVETKSKKGLFIGLGIAGLVVGGIAYAASKPKKGNAKLGGTSAKTLDEITI
jgi:hypothetical protein